MAKVYDNATDLITFARSSSGTALRRVGYGENLVTNGDFATGDLTGWIILGTDATHSVTYSSGGARYQSDTTSPVLIFEQNGILEVGKLYQITVETTAYTSGSLKTDSFSGTKVVSTGLGTVTINSVASATSFTIYRNSSNVDITIDNISVREVIFDRPTDDLVLFNHPDDIPRIEYGSDGSLKGLLIEEARTNLVRYSSAVGGTNWIDGANTATQTITLNSATAPDGTLSATLVELYRADTTGFTYLSQVTGVAAGDHVGSFWVKAKAGADVGKVISIWQYTPTDSVVNRKEITLSADWVRVHTDATASLSAHASGEPAAIGFRSTVGSTGNVDFYVWGGQGEQGSFPTSYIPTSGGQKTRDPDIASIPVSAFGYNQEAGTVVVEASAPTTDANYGAVSIDDGTNNNRIQVFAESTADVRFQIVDGGAHQGNIDLGTTSPSTPFRSAATIVENDMAHSVDGSVVGTDTTCTIPSVYTVRLGSLVGSNYLNGHIKSIQYYPRRLTNAQLQELTS